MQAWFSKKYLNVVSTFCAFLKSWLSERRLLKKGILEAASVLIHKSLTPQSLYKINYSKVLTERKQHLKNTFLSLRMQFTSLLMNPSVIKRFQTRRIVGLFYLVLTFHDHLLMKILRRMKKKRNLQEKNHCHPFSNFESLNEIREWN